MPLIARLSNPAMLDQCELFNVKIVKDINGVSFSVPESIGVFTVASITEMISQLQYQIDVLNLRKNTIITYLATQPKII